MIKDIPPTASQLAGSAPTLLLAFALVRVAVPVAAHAEFSTHQSLPGLVYYSETREAPPMRLFIAEVSPPTPTCAYGWRRAVPILMAPGNGKPRS